MFLDGRVFFYWLFLACSFFDQSALRLQSDVVCTNPYSQKIQIRTNIGAPLTKSLVAESEMSGKVKRSKTPAQGLCAVNRNPGQGADDVDEVLLLRALG